MIGERPSGWYCRYGPGENTRRLVVEEGGFLYDCDYYGDDLPFWVTVDGKPQLVVPYSLTNNDGKYMIGIGNSDQWFALVNDAFDMLYREGATQPKMMSVGMHMPPARPRRPRRRPRAAARLHGQAQGRVDHQAGRDRQALAQDASVSGQGIE